ncbi:MAG: tetraacyldisaccharide 4'-kinase [Armatimonadota bacterium]
MKLFFAGGLQGQIELRLKQLAENSNLAPILVPLRNLVWMAVGVRNCLKPQKPYRAPIPVISVGNITVGGTGKTPFVKWLVRRLTETGCRPAVLTPLSENADEVKEHNAENLSMSVSCPVFPGRDRVKNVKRAIEGGATVIVLDDGFQYRSLHRDVDIVLWDATSFLSSCNLFLREPLTSLRRATCIVISKADALDDEGRERLKRQIEKWAGQGKVIAAFGYEPAEVRSLESGKLLESDNFRSSKVMLVSSIANPRYFFMTAQRAGFNVVAMVCFPDHHRYNSSDTEFISELAKAEGAGAVLTTQKDAVKLKGLWHGEIPLLVLEVKLRWLWGEERLWEMIERSVHSKVQC